MKELYKSLAKFQQEVRPIYKGTEGYGYNYADLTAILNDIRPLLEKNGLAFSQVFELIEGKNCLSTIVFHAESGEFITSTVSIPKITLKGMNDYQCFGSGVTYYRRYSLSAILGLVTDKDIDACGEQLIEAKKPKESLDNAISRMADLIGDGKPTDTHLGWIDKNKALFSSEQLVRIQEITGVK